MIDRIPPGEPVHAMVEDAVVPGWLARLAAVGWRLLASVALGLVLFAIAVELSTVTVSIIVALIAAAVLAPTVRGLRARGASKTVAAGLACLVAAAILAIAIVLLAVALIPSIREIVDAVAAGIDDIRDELAALGAPAVVSEAFDAFIRSLEEALTVDLGALAGSLASLATIGVLGGFLTFFLLQDGERGWAWLMAPLDPWRAETVTASAEAGARRVGGYLRRTTILAVIDAVAVAIVLGLLGVPLAGPLVVVIFIGGFIPYLGAIVSTAIVVLATVALAGTGPATLVLLVVVVETVLTDRLLADTPLGRAVDVHPVVVLLAIPAGAALFGLLGLLALLPITVFVLAVAKSLIIALDLEPPGAARSGATQAGVPAWLDRLGQWSWRGLVVVGLLWLVVQIAVRLPVVVVPGVLAIVIAATLAPVVKRLRGAGWSPSAAAAGITVGTAVVVTAVLAVSVVWTIGPLGDIVATAIDGADETGLEWLESLVEAVGSGIIVDIARLLGALLGFVLASLLALLLTFYLLRDGGAWWQRSIDRLDAARRARVDGAGRRAVEVLGGYMIGTAGISLFGAITSAGIMVILGLPLAVPVGILTFFGGFIPYIGSFVTTALAFLIAVAVGSTTDIVVMAIFTVVFNIIQGNFVTPLVYGRALSLHPAVVLVAIPAGNQIAGILGMFLVVPAVAVVAATWRSVLDSIEPGSAGGAELPDVVDDREEGDAGDRPDDDER
jgi:predicted PurR-regulated permease PerM